MHYNLIQKKKKIDHQYEQTVHLKRFQTAVSLRRALGKLYQQTEPPLGDLHNSWTAFAADCICCISPRTRRPAQAAM